jgi:hypothetical protein
MAPMEDVPDLSAEEYDSSVYPGTEYVLRARINEVELERNRQRCIIFWWLTTTDAWEKLHHCSSEVNNRL